MTYRTHPALSTDIFEFVHPRILRAVRAASEALDEAGVRHAICGGFAVGAYGHVRATKDVDFLVGEEAFTSRGVILSFAPGVPYQIDGVATDMVPLRETDPVQDRSFLESEIDEPFGVGGLPVVGPEALIAMKLIAYRPQDRSDIRALLDAGACSASDVRIALHRWKREDLIEKLTRLGIADD